MPRPIRVVGWRVPQPRHYLEGSRGVPTPGASGFGGAQLASGDPGRRGVGVWGPLPAGGSGGGVGAGAAGTHCLNIFSMSLICFLENSLNSV